MLSLKLTIGSAIDFKAQEMFYLFIFYEGMGKGLRMRILNPWSSIFCIEKFKHQNFQEIYLKRHTDANCHREFSNRVQSRKSTLAGILHSLEFLITSSTKFRISILIIFISEAIYKIS